MNCPKCNFSIPEGDAFCPNCGTSINAPVSEPIISTPVDGLNLRGCATVAPETPVYAAPVNKPSKGLAIAAYILYAIAILVFAFFILVMGFGLDFSRSSGSLKLPAGDIAVTVKPGGSVTIPAGHPVYTEMNAVTAEELFDAYDALHGGRAVAENAIHLEPHEVRQLFKDLGLVSHDDVLYDVYKYTLHSSFEEIDNHALIYMTEDFYNSIRSSYHRDAELNTAVDILEYNGAVYTFWGPVGYPSYQYVENSLKKNGDVWNAEFFCFETEQYYLVTYVRENGLFKISDVKDTEKDTPVDTPVQAPTDVPAGHKVYTEMNSSSVQSLIDNYWCYHYCGECRGEKEYIDFEAAVSVFEAAGLDGNISQAYTLNRLKCCNTLREVDQHALLYMTPEVAKDAYTRTTTSSGFEDAFTFEADGKAYVAWGNMGHDGIYVEDGTLKQENGKWTVKTCYYSPGEDVPDPAYKFTFNNDAGYYRIDSVTPLF